MHLRQLTIDHQFPHFLTLSQDLMGVLGSQMIKEPALNGFSFFLVGGMLLQGFLQAGNLASEKQQFQDRPPCGAAQLTLHCADVYIHCQYQCRHCSRHRGTNWDFLLCFWILSLSFSTKGSRLIENKNETRMAAVRLNLTMRVEVLP